MRRKILFTVPFVIVAAILAATAGRTMNVPAISAISVILFALPAYQGIMQEYGLKKGLIIISFFYIFAMIIETLALLTGFPYGHFSYGTTIGFKVAGIIPWTVGFAWSPLFFGAVAITRTSISNKYLRVAAVTALLVIIDTVLDPGAVTLGYWTYQQPGWYYGVPWSNFIGWICSSALASFLFELLWPRFPFKNGASIQASLLLILFFWTTVAGTLHLWVPFLIGILLLVWLLNKRETVQK